MSALFLIDYVVKTYGNIPLNRVCVIGVQHILQTTLDMFEGLFSLGLKPENVHLLGKCYSANSLVYDRMNKKGVKVSPLSFYFNSHQSFDDCYTDIVRKFLAETLATIDFSQFDKVILLDDGGQFLLVAQELGISSDNVIGIEQTSSGHEKIKNKNLDFPVVNVARSTAKLVHETPFIANLIIEKMFKRLEKLHIIPRKALIIGNGIIGSGVHAKLSEVMDVNTYDIDSLRSDFARDDFPDLIQKHGLIIGCTGKTSVAHEYHPYFNPKTVLVSASSSDREFDAHHLRKKIPLTKNCHEDLHIDDIYLLNCGFPVNFEGGIHSAPPHFIQLTRALIAAAILQACKMEDRRSGLVPMDGDIQWEITQKHTQYITAYLSRRSRVTSPSKALRK